MKKTLMIVLILVLTIVVFFGLFKLLSSEVIKGNDNDEEIYVNILEDEEKGEELKLNANNKTIYYYFNIVNYNEQISKYNQRELTPYIKFNIENKENLSELLSWNIYKINSENDSEENWKEIKEKGESDSQFKEYYKCENLLPYEQENENNNIHNYVVKINLNTQIEDYTNLEEDLSNSFSIILGYKEVK